MSRYLLAQINIMDRNEFRKYEKELLGTLSPYNAEILAVDDDPIVIEGNYNYTRTVIIRFSTEKELKKWYDSKEYQEILSIRQAASEGNLLILTGKEGTDV